MPLTPPSLTRLLLRAVRRRPMAIDPADMGTCFGLEMTLDDPPPEPTNFSRRWWQRPPAARPARP